MAARDLVFSLVFRAVDQATGGIGRINSALHGATAQLGGLARAAGDASQRFSNSFAGIGAIVAEGFSFKAVAAQEEYFRRMRINSGLGEDAVGRLRQTMRTATDLARISGDDMLGAFKAFREVGGSVPAFEANANTMAMAIQLLGGHAAEVGELVALMQTKMALKTPDELIQSLATLRLQFAGVEGGIDAFVAASPLLMSTYAALGHSGKGAVKELGAVMSLIGKGAGSARQARTLTEGFLTNLQDQGYQQHLASWGVKVWKDPSDPRSGVRSATDIIRQITEAFVRDPYTAQMAFGKDLGQALKVPIGEIKTTGKSATMERLFSAEGDPAAFLQKAEEASEGLGASLNELRNAVEAVAQQNLAAPIGLFAKVLSACAGPLGHVLMSLAALAAVGHTISWIGGAVSGFRTLISVLPLASTVMGVFSATLWGCPITWIIAGVLALAAAVYVIYRNWDGISAWWSAKWDAVKAAFDRSWGEGIVKILAEFNPWVLVAEAWDGLIKNLFGIDLAAAGRNMIDSLIRGIKERLSDLPEPIRKALGWADKAWSGAGQGIKSVAGSAWSGVKSVASGAVSAVAKSDAAKYAMSFFEKKGWSHEQAAGLAANLGVESGFKAGAVGDNGKAYGIAQWHPDRQRAFAAFAGRDIRGASLDEQLAFVHHELTAGSERGAGRALAQAQDAAAAGAVVSRLYERPADREGEANRRAATAQALAGAGGPSAPVPSAFAGAPSKAALDGTITVRIEGLPGDARASARSDTPGVRLGLDLGHTMAGVA
jgi:hypothetical protein